MPPAVLMGIMAASSAMSAMSQIAGGVQAKSAAGAQAREFENEAKLEQLNAGSKIAAENYEANQAIATGRTTAAAGGLRQGGSAQTVENTNVTEQTIRNMYTRFSGDLASTEDLYRAKQARFEGQKALEAGFIGAGGNALTSALRIGVAGRTGNPGFLLGRSGGAP